MRDPDLPIRVDSVFALRSFVEALETIVDKFGEEMAPYALGLCQNLVRIYVVRVLFA